MILWVATHQISKSNQQTSSTLNKPQRTFKKKKKYMHNRITKNLIKSRSLLHIMKVGPTTIPYNDKLKIENWKLKYTQLLFRTENQNRNHKRPRSRNNHGWVLSIMIQESWIQGWCQKLWKKKYIYSNRMKLKVRKFVLSGGVEMAAFRPVWFRWTRKMRIPQ